MKISFRKLKHLYIVYGLLNFILILSVILISIYVYHKQSILFEIENTLGNELMNLSDYKSNSFDYAFKSTYDDDFFNLETDSLNSEFVEKIKNSKTKIKDVTQKLSFKNLHFDEKLKGLLSDYDILILENELLLSYINKLGNSKHGTFFSLKKAADDFRLKLASFSPDPTIMEDFDQSVFLVSLLNRNRDKQLINEIEVKLYKIQNKVSVPDSSYNNYLLYRLSDSFQNFDNTYIELAKTILAIGVNGQNGLIKKIDSRYLKTKLRIQESLQIIQNEKDNLEIVTILSIILLFFLIVVINFGSVHYFLMQSRKFIFTLNEHFKSLAQAKFNLIDRKKAPLEFHNLIDGLEDFSSKLINSGQRLRNLSTGNLNTELESNHHLELFYDSIIKIKQKIEKLNNQLIEEKKKQAEMLWIKQGLENLTEVMRQEFNDPLLHSSKIIYALVHYLEIPMGAIYHSKDEGGVKFLEMVASFAYGKEKQLYKKISIGEGIVGTAAAEKKLLNLTNIPDGYFNIVSGFSESKPKNIIVSPIKLNEDIYGVIELASLSKFKDEEIIFIEEVCKAVAYSFAISNVYMDTLNLFETSKLEITQLKSENELILIDYEELNGSFKKLKVQSVDNEYIIERLNEFAIVINLDLDGNILEVNNQFEQVFKLEKKKFQHSNYREYMMNVNSELDFELIWKDLRSGIKHELNQKINLANRELWLNQHFFPMFDLKGRVKGIKIIGFNITDKFQIENSINH